MAKRIKLKGDIIPDDYKWIYDIFEMDAICPRDVEKAIEEAGEEDLIFEINSYGGDLYAGSEIYTMIKNFGRADIEIVGMAGSAASVIAMAGRVVRISPTAAIMIHNVSMYDSGDYRVFEHDAELLKRANVSIANAYRLKTGLSEERLLELMSAGGSRNYGTELNAQQAKELGFVDEIMFDSGRMLVASRYGLSIPLEVIRKVRELIPRPKNESKIDLLKARLDLIKLKGRIN